MRFPICIFIVLLVAACGQSGDNSTDGKEKSDVKVHVDSESKEEVTPDSVRPPKLSDTANFTDPFQKDSIRIHIAFQRNANDMATAIRKRSALAYSQFTPKPIIAKYGSRSKFVEDLDAKFHENDDSILSVVAGPIRRIALAQHDGYAEGWYCLMPVTKYYIRDGDLLKDKQWFGGQTLDEGKTCYFMNITNVEKASYSQIMPDLHFVMDKEELQ